MQDPIATERDLDQAKARVEAIFKGDVRDQDAQAWAMEQAVNVFDSLDITVAKAGVSPTGAIAEFSSEEISSWSDM
ncbi:hypothetical protein [Vacuolonema iberomarrocanum]|uniref:hypothetical protein n=1 Tax=Vacuolonema iberomarrocanum TaxID=3454632 RepID=UPI0019FA879F|nr:SDR family oxidoreductase [filamentous cyanobacterium LEGE 07170]